MINAEKSIPQQDQFEQIGLRILGDRQFEETDGGDPELVELGVTVRYEIIDFEGQAAFRSLHVNEYQGHPDEGLSFYFDTIDDEGSDRLFVMGNNGSLQERSLVYGESSEPFDISDEELAEFTPLLELAADMHETKEARAVARQAQAREAYLENSEELTLIDDEDERISIIERAQSDCDDSVFEAIHKHDLGPYASQKLTDELTVHYSKVARLGSRLTSIVYLESAEGIKPAIYYLSNSQAVWRYLSSHNNDDSGHLKHYGKGDDESSTVLPAIIQRSLALLSESDKANVDRVDADMLMTSLSPLSTSDIVLDIESRDTIELLENYGKTQRMSMFDQPYFTEAPNTPEEIAVDILHPERAPNLDQRIATWTQADTMYSAVDVTVVPSKDDTLHYMYMQDSIGRVWIGNVEDITAPIRQNGLRQGYVKSGIASMPVYEYASQAGSAKPENWDRAAKGYVDVSAFIGRIPLIQAFKDARDQ